MFCFSLCFFFWFDFFSLASYTLVHSLVCWYAHLLVVFSRGNLFIHQIEEYTYINTVNIIRDATHTNTKKEKKKNARFDLNGDCSIHENGETARRKQRKRASKQASKQTIECKS